MALRALPEIGEERDCFSNSARISGSTALVSCFVIGFWIRSKRTVFHELGHSERKTQRHNSEENHGVFEKRNRRDCHPSLAPEQGSGWRERIKKETKHTHSSLLKKPPPSKYSSLNPHIATTTSGRCIRINSEIKLLRATIFPRVTPERLPDTKHFAVRRDVDAVRRKDVLCGADVEEV